MLQTVINYEFNAVRYKANIHNSLDLEKINRYKDWNLHNTIRTIFNHDQYSLKWIGNDKNAHIMALFYCLVMGSLESSSKNDQPFTKFKFHLYELSQEFLSLEEQKSLVENMCLFRNSKNIVQFLSKANTLQQLIVKVFQKYRTKNSPLNTQSKIQLIQAYLANFGFFSSQLLNQKVIKISNESLSFYIIDENSCFFVCNGNQSVEDVFLERSVPKIQRSRQNSKKKPTKNKRISFDSPISPITPHNQVTFQQNLQERKQWIDVFKEESEEGSSIQKNHELKINLKNVGSERLIAENKLLMEIKELPNPEKLKIEPRNQLIYQSLGTNGQQKFKKIELKGTEERKRAPKFILEKRKTEGKGKEVHGQKSFKESKSIKQIHQKHEQIDKKYDRI